LLDGLIVNIQEYNKNNITFLKQYFTKEEQKINDFLISSLKKQVKKLTIRNKYHLERMDKLSRLTDTVVFIDNVELFLSSGTINEPTYKNIRLIIEGRYQLSSYYQETSMEDILKIYESNKMILNERIKKFNEIMKMMKLQEKSLKKFIKVLYDFNFTNAKTMTKNEIITFFKSKFKELEFY